MVKEKSCNHQKNDKTSLEKYGVEPVKPILKNIYQSNTDRKDLSWPHFNNKPRVQEKQQVKDQQYRIFNSKVQYRTLRQCQPDLN